MKLSDQIEEYRKALIASHRRDLGLVRSLGAELDSADSELMRELEAVCQAQETRGRDIATMLRTIASRIGYLPTPEIESPPMPRVLRKVA